MIGEMLYTSAVEGLFPGSRGFCTVAATGGLSRRLIDKLEALSHYTFAYDFAGSQAHLNPVAVRFHRVAVRTRHYQILSRIAPVAADYSGRSNYLAHHLVLDPDRLPAGGPAWLARQPGVFREAWDSPPRELPPRRLPSGESTTSTCMAWQAVAGDAGWGGILARAAAAPRQPIVTLLVPGGVDTLTLFDEAFHLLPAAQRWRNTFDTYHTAEAASGGASLRAVLQHTAAAKAFKPEAFALDLSSAGHPPPDRFTVAARQGHIVAPEATGQPDQHEPPPLELVATPPSSATPFGSAPFTLNRRDPLSHPEPQNVGHIGFPDRPWWRRQAVFVSAAAILLLVAGGVMFWQFAPRGPQLTAAEPTPPLPSTHASASDGTADTKPSAAADEAGITSLEHLNQPPPADEASDPEGVPDLNTGANPEVNPGAEAPTALTDQSDHERNALTATMPLSDSIPNDANQETATQPEPAASPPPVEDVDSRRVPPTLSVRDPIKLEDFQPLSTFRPAERVDLQRLGSARLQDLPETSSLTIQLVLTESQLKKGFSLSSKSEPGDVAAQSSVNLNLDSLDQVGNVKALPLLRLLAQRAIDDFTEIAVQQIGSQTKLETSEPLRLLITREDAEEASWVVYLDPAKAIQMQDPQPVDLASELDPPKSFTTFSLEEPRESKFIVLSMDGTMPMALTLDAKIWQPNGFADLSFTAGGKQCTITWADQAQMRSVQRWLWAHPPQPWAGSPRAYRLSDKADHQAEKSDPTPPDKIEARHKELGEKFAAHVASPPPPFEVRAYDVTGVLLKRQWFVVKMPVGTWPDLDPPPKKSEKE